MKGESESGSGEASKIAPEALSHNADAEVHEDKQNEKRRVTETGRFAGFSGVCQIAQVVESTIVVAYSVYSESESRRRSRGSFGFGVAPVPRCVRRSEWDQCEFEAVPFRLLGPKGARGALQRVRGRRTRPQQVY